MTSADPKHAVARRAVFLDRDGTLNEDTGHTFRVEDLKVLPRAGEGLKRISDMGFVLIVVTNQSGIAHGYFTEKHLNAFNAAISAELAKSGVQIARYYHSPFHPKGVVKEFAIQSLDRKPEIGMLKRAAADFNLDLSRSYMIGDRETDMQAGHRAGCTTILLPRPRDVSQDMQHAIASDYKAAHLVEAARVIEQHESLRKPG